MKIPTPKGVITVFGNQQEARNIEKGHTPGQTNVYQLKTADEKVSGILPGYSCKEGRRVEDGLLLEFPCTPTRTRSV
jgi:hypothetical protein